MWCNDLIKGGYSDWFLPSRIELIWMYNNLEDQGSDAVGSFVDSFYWSSSEYDAGNAWGQYFLNGYQEYYDKGSERRVRAVRAF